MGFVKTPVKGMNDILPKDMRVRQHVLSLIRKSYAAYGFSEIETPCMENIGNLTGKQGGENEKLIFKVMKRGAELERAQADGKGEYADLGMRYDLTVPLSRYYAAHTGELPVPFKALQIGPVWRADRPQKGRFRQFVQCDIDVLGDDSSLAEIELISATSCTLYRIFSEVGIERFTVHVNDRRILRAMVLYAGFDADACDTVFIELDKMDKIGKDGVRESLIALGYAEHSVDKYLALFEQTEQGIACRDFCDMLGEHLDARVSEGLETILSCTRAMIPDSVSLVFDPTLVRGMSYYTGTIFEITVDEYNFSVGGGGRYDEMIGKFSGQRVPACGFSLGFERIVTILRDMPEIKLEDGVRRIALLLDAKLSRKETENAFRRAAALRAEGAIVTVEPLKKNAKFQMDKLQEDGYTEIERIYPSR